MDGVARVRFRDVIVLMPFHRACEKELAFESAEFYAQRFGEIRLELDQCEIEVCRRRRPVRSGKRRRPLLCGQCGQVPRVAFVMGHKSFCLRCAREWATAAGNREESPAALSA
jgi:hypothetical protein